MFNTPILQTQRKSDTLGAIASGLCLIHCLATPLLFVAHAGAHHAEGPAWWGLIDITLLAVSLAAVVWAVRKTSKNWMKWALSASWLLLALILLNEKAEAFHLAEAWIYLPTVSLIVLHIYNTRYCYCDEDGCCTDSVEKTA
ncbi:MAG TPA: MerC domain-containing protein [Cytophagales bacterium]|nr:MerC domain-containing protein [Cytophagales bacterium]HAA21557.1 MerC domain-containing protein [Cytophagales bacterium]HAP59048.1 MerC domain-containing protein [Cytophagales bacterium]